ncbi:MAG: hypothetical protein LCH85_08470 [Chloroflexi bacterium]|nr:hypothetical protein [Chloroflexota bacterium]
MKKRSKKYKQRHEPKRRKNLSAANTKVLKSDGTTAKFSPVADQQGIFTKSNTTVYQQNKLKEFALKVSYKLAYLLIERQVLKEISKIDLQKHWEDLVDVMSDLI